MSEAKDTKELVARALDYAKHVDLYTLVGLEGDPSTHQDPKSIHRSWRKTSVKHHPDKTGDSFDKDKWELLEHARDILLEPAARAAYDNARAAQSRRAAERAKVQGTQKRFIDELEAAELEAKRRRVEQEEKRQELEREKARLREEGERRIAEENERVRREHLEKQAREKNQEEDELDAREAELQRRLDENKRRRAAKKAARKARKEGREVPSPEPEEPLSKTERAESGGDTAGMPKRESTPPPPVWEDLKARMIAMQRKRDAAKLAKQQAEAEKLQQADGEKPVSPAEHGMEA